VRRAAGLLVFTDLDACLLDEETYRYDEARPALEALRRASVPLVLCTSKTRAEVEPLHRELGLHEPFVFENGGGLCFPPGARGWRAPVVRRGGGAFVVPLGTPHPALVAAISAIADETGLALRGFSSLTAEEVAAATGLSPEAARRAALREFDEPFLIEDSHGPDAEGAVAEAARRRGLRVTRGGRFHHLTGPVDKGGAVRQLLALHEAPVVSIGLGDSANDLTLLQAVDRPVIVPRPDGSADETLAAALPGAARAPRPGPRGWSEAVLQLLEESGVSAEGGRAR